MSKEQYTEEQIIQAILNCCADYGLSRYCAEIGRESPLAQQLAYVQEEVEAVCKIRESRLRKLLAQFAEFKQQEVLNRSCSSCGAHLIDNKCVACNQYQPMKTSNN